QSSRLRFLFFFQAEDGIRDLIVTGVQTCALPIFGGSLVTIMAFGIPGDAVTAVMLGALTIHGIQSGPLFISQNTGLAYGIFAAYLLAHPIVVLILALGARWMLRLVTPPKAALFPVVLVLCVIGAYALHNTLANVSVLP